MTTLQAAMAAQGLVPHKALDLQPDGRFNRFQLSGDKSGSRNGWAVLHEEFGSFGSWKTGETHTWHAARTQPATPAERAATEQRIKEARAAYIKERAAVQAQAQAKAHKLWKLAKPATNDHAYLVRKGVNAYGVRQLNGALVIPARDTSGTLHSLQFIANDGSKRFLTGGRLAGCYFAIGKPDGVLLLAEGIATACTLYQATGRAVAACFSCGNMLAVAQALRAKFPSLKLIMCADNDAKTPGNPGATKAREAAQAVGGFMASLVYGEVAA